MSQRAKLLEAIRRNPADVRLSDAFKAAEMVGFLEKGGKGAHHAFARSGETMILNFQDRGDGRIPTYQAKQLIVMLDKYLDQL